MKKHACPSCGATLGIPDRHERVFTCSFCGTVLEDQAVNPTTPDPTATPQITIVTNWADASSVPTYSAPKAAAGCGAVSLIILVAVIGAVGAVAYFAIGGVGDVIDSVNGNSSGLDGYSLRSAALVPGEGESGDDVVTIVQGDDTWVVHYLDLDADDVTRWHETLGVEAGTFDRYLATGDTIYASIEDQLFAWDRTSGDRRFAVTLSDVIENTICVDCVRIIGQSLVTLTADGVLAGHDLTTGAPRWSVTLAGAPRQLVDFGGQAAVLDESDAGGPVVKLFEVTQGQPAGVLPLDCGGGDGPGIYDHLVPLPDGGFFWEGTDIITSCAQRWTPGSTGPTWSTPLPDGGSAVDNDADIFTVAGDRVAVLHGGTISWYSIETGERAQTVRENENLVILGTGDGIVYLGAESTRGSSTWTILAVDPATGQPRWSYEPGTDRVDGFTTINVTSDGWLPIPIPGGLVVATHDDDANTVRLQVLDVADGTSTDPVTVALDTYGIVAWPSFIGTDDGRLVMGASTTVMVVDPTTGEIVSEAP